MERGWQAATDPRGANGVGFAVGGAGFGCAASKLGSGESNQDQA
jgi:hypothetical protein